MTKSIIMDLRRVRRNVRYYRGPRSLLSLRMCRVTFKNLTGAPVSLYWVDFNGRKKLYGKLYPMKRRDSGYTVNTFVTHPWVAEDSETREKVRVNFKRVFYAPAPQNILPLEERAGMWKYMYVKCRKALLKKLENRKSSDGVIEQGEEERQEVESARSGESREVNDEEQPSNSNNSSEEGGGRDEELAVNQISSTTAYEVLVTKSVLSLELISSLAICQLVGKEDLKELPLPDILKRTLKSTYSIWY